MVELDDRSVSFFNINVGNLKSSPTISALCHSDLPIVCVNDLSGNTQSQARPIVRCRKAGFEYSIDIVVPGPADREAVDTIIFDELTDGIVQHKSRDRYLEIVDDLVAAGADGVVLGCTEIELLIEQGDRPEIPLFDTTALHVDRAIAYGLGERTDFADS